MVIAHRLVLLLALVQTACGLDPAQEPQEPEPAPGATQPGPPSPVLGIDAGTTTTVQGLNQDGIARLNQDAQALWAQDGLGLAHDAALHAAQALVGVPHPITSKITATVIGIDALTLDCPGAPGVRRLDGDRIDVAVPLAGAWH